MSYPPLLAKLYAQASVINPNPDLNFYANRTTCEINIKSEQWCLLFSNYLVWYSFVSGDT